MNDKANKFNLAVTHLLGNSLGQYLIDFKTQKDEIKNREITKSLIQAVLKAMQGAKKQVDVESFVVCSVFCEQEERDALESALRQTSGVGATYIDMEQTF